jgi:hypothetical protein
MERNNNWKILLISRVVKGKIAFENSLVFMHKVEELPLSLFFSKKFKGIDDR